MRVGIDHAVRKHNGSANPRSPLRTGRLQSFAFTATPKPRTLELFGTKRTDGKFAPFHLYSMRQAIEEGFILDVLVTNSKRWWLSPGR